MKSLLNRFIIPIGVVATLIFSIGLGESYAQFDDDEGDELFLYYEEKGGSGSFGTQLSKFENPIKVSGYVVNKFSKEQGEVGSFDNHYFNVFVNAPIGDNVLAEIQLEHEHGGDELQVRYAQLDWIIDPSFVIRTGKFLVPVGSFNEYLYPEYIAKTINRPYALREIVPVAWGEVGVQFRGKYELNSAKLNYAAFLVNGLEGAEGGGIRKMRNNHRDKKDDDKAFGGQLGVTLSQGIQLGISGYSGAYTENGDRRLSVLDADFSYSYKGLSFRGEFAMALQEVSKADSETETENLNKWGYYLQGSYKHGKYEPLIRFDQIDFDGDEKDKWRVTVGANYYITDSFVAKINYDYVQNGGDEDVEDNVFGLQLALGF